MIKITNFADEKCKVVFELDPVRPARIHEPELGKAVAEKLNDFYVTKEGKIYKFGGWVGLDHPIKRLKEMHALAQEELSKAIQKLKYRLDEFKFIQGLVKREKEKVKKGE